MISCLGPSVTTKYGVHMYSVGTVYMCGGCYVHYDKTTWGKKSKKNSNKVLQILFSIEEQRFSLLLAGTSRL